MLLIFRTKLVGGKRIWMHQEGGRKISHAISPATRYVRFSEYTMVDIWIYFSILIYKMSASINNQQKSCPGKRKTSNWPLTFSRLRSFSVYPFPKNNKNGLNLPDFANAGHIFGFQLSIDNQQLLWINHLIHFIYIKVVWAHIVIIKNDISIFPATRYAIFSELWLVNRCFIFFMLFNNMWASIFDQKKWCPGSRNTSKWPLTFSRLRSSSVYPFPRNNKNGLIFPIHCTILVVNCP